MTQPNDLSADAKVYVSGGIKGVPDFLIKFATAADEVAQWATPVNPTEIEPCGDLECIYPGELLASGHTWQCFMRHDIEEMVHCQGIYMMRGWETSKGASEELRLAQVLGLRVFFQPDTLTASLQRRIERAMAQVAAMDQESIRQGLLEPGGTSLEASRILAALDGEGESDV